MKKSNIIKSSREYTEIIKNCEFLKNSFYIIYYRENSKGRRYGISVPTKFGKAVLRNKYKRRIKNIIDKNEINIQNNYDYVIIIRKALIKLDYLEMQEKLMKLFNKIGENNEKK